MIYTVTFNPAIDYVVHFEHLRPGEINRNESEEFPYGIDRCLVRNHSTFRH